MATMTLATSRRLGLLVLLVFLTVLSIGSSAQDNPKPAEQKKELTEITKLKADNFRLKAQLVNCSETINKAQLQKEQDETLRLVKQELGSDCNFNWSTLSCQ